MRTHIGRSRPVSLILALSLAGCAGSAGTRSGSASLSDAKAAVFRSMFLENASALKHDAAAFCIGTGTGWNLEDPDPSTLQALGSDPKVKPASACDPGPRGEKVIDRATGRAALLFGIERLECIAASNCRFRGSYYEGNMSGQTNLYRARLLDGHWRVVREETGPVS